MKFNRWTLGLAAVGAVSLASAARADEAKPSASVLTSLSATTLSGYIDTTAAWKLGTGDVSMPGRVYDGSSVGTSPYNHDGFNLNVVSLTLDKPLEEGQWSAGYHVQLLLGPGADKRGTGLLQPTGARNSLAFNEAYISLRVPIGNGIEFHVGQFGTYNGYEAYDTYKNPNFSRSYGFDIESSAHTGVSASYQITSALSVQAAVADAGGFNNQVDAEGTQESRKAYLTFLTLTAPDSWGWLKGGTLSGGYTVADQKEGLYTTSSRQGNLYAGASIPTPITGLAFGLAYDYTYGSAFKESYANAIALYTSYQVTEKFKVNNRIDYARGSNGSLGGVGKVADNGAFGYISKGDHEELLSETLTADYSLWKNVISRAEFRWDHSLTGEAIYGGTLTPLGGVVGLDKNSYELTANIIYQF